MRQSGNKLGLLFGAGLILAPTLAAQPIKVNPMPRHLRSVSAGDRVNPTGRHPDLVVTEISGPAEAYVGDTMLVNFAVENVGDPLGNGYTYRADLVISPDLTVDSGDTVIGTFMVTQSNMGLQSMNISIPTSFSAGNYYWGLWIVDPVPGELITVNNTKLGDLFEIVRTDLDLETDLEILGFARVSDPVGPAATIRVNNAGTDQSIMLYSVADLSAVPWLSVDPVSGISVSGAEGSDINLQFNHAGLLPGDYFTTLRFTNDLIPTDTEDVPIQLTVGEAYFAYGQLFQGQISAPGDLDRITFHGIKGLVLTLQTRSLTGSIKPVLTVIDPDGVVEKVLKFRATGDFVKKKIKLRKSGLYAVEVTGRGATTGSYKVKTDRRMPTKARASTKKMHNPAGGGDGEVGVLLLPGAVLEYMLKPNAKFLGPVSSTLTTPSGAIFDVSGNSETNADGTLVVTDLHLSDAGLFTIGVFGWGADTGAKVTANILPFQPRRSSGKIYLP